MSTLLKVITAEPLPVVQPREPNTDQAYRFRQETVEYLRRLGTFFTGQNIYDTLIQEFNTNVFEGGLPTATPPAALVNQIGGDPVWITVPDLTRYWVLGFDPSDQMVKWLPYCKPNCCCLSNSATVNFTHTRSIIGTPPGTICQQEGTVALTGTVQMDSTTNSYHFAGTSGTNTGNGVLVCGTTVGWTGVAVTGIPNRPGPCSLCTLDPDPVTTSGPYDGTSYCTGVIVTTYATSTACGIVIIDVTTIKVNP